MHELELDPLLQTGEQRRPMARQNRLHEELVLVDQPQIRQGQREGHATHPAGPYLDGRLDHFSSLAGHCCAM